MRILVDMQGSQCTDRDSEINSYLTSFLKALIDSRTKHEVYMLFNALCPHSAEVIRSEFSTLLPEDRFIVFHAVGSANESNPNNEWNARTSELIREKIIDDIAPDFSIVTSLFIGFRNDMVISIGSYCNNIPTAVVLYGSLTCTDSNRTPAAHLKKKWFKRKIKSIKQADILLILSPNTINNAVKLLEKVHSQKSQITLQRDIRRSTSFLLDLIGEIKYTKMPLEKDLSIVVASIEKNEKTSSKLLIDSDADTMLRWRVEGPFVTSFSLALLNRETALALSSLGHDVALHYVEDGVGDIPPSEHFLQNNSAIDKLHQRSSTLRQTCVDVTSRNMYPPYVDDMFSQTTMLHHYAWEESGFPQDWVRDFNQYLTGMTCLAPLIEKIMIDNGVTVPIATSGCGVDHWERVVADDIYPLETKNFCFLHVSTCTPRKGADILLKAYASEFSNTEDVSLIIKTVPWILRDLQRWVNEAKQTTDDFPHIIIIEDDLTNEQLKALYEQCHVLVGPSRAEGFGLPLAEAMLSGLPVITTGWGGQLEFCNQETAWLIDYEFKLAKTHFELYDSVWAEPSQKHLSKLMRDLFEMPEELRVVKSKYGRKLLLKNFTWRAAAQRLVDSAKVFSSATPPRPPQIGWITTWNTKCSIASYSEYLIAAMDQDVTILASHTSQSTKQDSSNVYRCWQAGNDSELDELAQNIDKFGLEVIVIQFNYALFHFGRLNDFIVKQTSQGRTVVMMMHTTDDLTTTAQTDFKTLLSGLKASSRLLVHTYHDLNRLKNYGLLDNVTLFPHGVFNWKAEKKEKNDSFILATYGFALPYKGLREFIDVVRIILDKGLDMKVKMINAEHPAAQSSNLINEVKEYIRAEGLTQYIELKSDYLSIEESLTLLNSADLIVYPYQKAEKSNSCSVRYGLATGRPVAVTPLKIFDDVVQAVFSLPGTQAEEMAEGLLEIINDIKENSKIAKNQHIAAKKWCDSHKYSTVGERLGSMLTALHQARN